MGKQYQQECNVKFGGRLIKVIEFVRNSPSHSTLWPFPSATLYHGHDSCALGALLSCEVTLGWKLQLIW